MCSCVRPVSKGRPQSSTHVRVAALASLKKYHHRSKSDANGRNFSLYNDAMLENFIVVLWQGLWTYVKSNSNYMLSEPD